MSKANKETTVKEADAKAQKLNEQKCKEGIFEEALKLYRKETHSVQQMLAYVRQLDKSGKLPEKKQDSSDKK